MEAILHQVFADGDTHSEKVVMCFEATDIYMGWLSFVDFTTHTDDIKRLMLNSVVNNIISRFSTRGKFLSPVKSVEIAVYKHRDVTHSQLDIHIEKLMAWTPDYVGIYHIEQECGEGWITLPKQPSGDTKSYQIIR